MKGFFLTRYLLAGGAATCTRTLYRLAKDKDPKIRRQLAENPDCPRELCALLASDEDPNVRIDCRLALRWLDESGPTQLLPQKFAEQVKALEKLGIVFRRNNKTLSLRRQRLKKVLDHESQKVNASYNFEDLLNLNVSAEYDTIVRSIA